jgi:NADPH:quinone reductase-like Zn-dependent oxidoreductase
MGYDVAGTVVAVGSSVSYLRPGDEVYSKVPEIYKGTVAEYALSTESFTAKRPKKLGFSASASIPLAAVTALKSLELGNQLLEGGLKGRTVLIPGGLSGTGHFGVQLAKNVFRCAKVITTLSPSKIQKFIGVFGDDYKIVDYTKENLLDVIPEGSVDFMFDTMGGALGALPLMKKGGVIVTVSSSMPSGTAMKEGGLDPPLLLVPIMNFLDWILRCWTWSKGVNYSSYFPKSSSGDLVKLAEWADEGKMVPVVGSRAKLSDIESVRKGCQQVLDGKGGVGKFVIEVE